MIRSPRLLSKRRGGYRLTEVHTSEAPPVSRELANVASGSSGTETAISHSPRALAAPSDGRRQWAHGPQSLRRAEGGEPAAANAAAARVAAYLPHLVGHHSGPDGRNHLARMLLLIKP